jgi:hypothetical protein
VPAYFGYIDADPDLARAYIVISQTVEAHRVRGRPDLAARAQAVYRQLIRDFAKLSELSARESEKLIRERVNATQVRPKSNPRASRRIAPAVHSRPRPPVLLPGGEVDVGDLAALDLAAVDPKYRSSGEYWRAQEYGTHAHVGRLVRGFFTDSRGGGGARYAPDPSERRNHPYFDQVSAGSDGKYPKGTPAMLIERPIEARHFMRDGFNLTVTWHRRKAQAIMNDAISRLP